MSPALQFESLAALDSNFDRPVHLAVGMFDGVHRGHRMVIDSAKRRAKEDGGVCGALTFWPHPSRLFRPDAPSRMILSPEIKRRKLAELGLEFIVEEAFTHAFASIEAEEFMSHLKRLVPQLRSVHAGENWRFGNGRSGDMPQLAALGEAAGVDVFSVGCLADGGARVSSTRIRDLLTLGNLEEANALLGYEYYSLGTVTQGKRMGRTIDAPTLNLPFEGDLRPAYGVYAVSVSDVSLKREYMGVANFGVRPTVEMTSKPLLEVFLLEKCPFDYGHRLKVVWHQFIRQERKFAGVDELKAQIAKDAEVAKAYFAERKRGDGI
ncbi:riboflavin biosynthesis protein RibF [Pelagicoccus sp. SDUM812003]|uniref:riboflavin biosynthesis protein RibF n=1 Tax=Pelagicoccus sp. SDUM812003 TaxID=3041267 RepID=UPI00280EC812|nr:riboflavin biosynthesis protein RibF [Pelagicoccus sp. SDUM812003]MDQ8204970.1 riboflavin biosynthesis protein RibF [Pelagicoccus sp. SDUM812003]